MQMADSGALRTRTGVGYLIHSPPFSGSLDKPSSSFELSLTRAPKLYFAVDLVTAQSSL